MNNLQIKETIFRFVRLVEEGCGSPEENEKELIFLLDALAYAIHHVEYTFDETEYPGPGKKTYDADRILVQQRFADYGYYNMVEEVVTKICETGIMVGDAIDDIADIYGELKETLWRWDNNSEADGLWYFHDFYIFHWQYHLRNLQLYLLARANDD